MHDIVAYHKALIHTDLRQCLIYDSHEADARLIGVEYMVPKSVYLSFTEDEQKLWHSHEYEVSSGMLILPKPENKSHEEWEAAELEAMKEITGLYGKTWHFWEVDAGHEYPLGKPHLMGSATQDGQVDLETVMKRRNDTFGVHHKQKADVRGGIALPGIHPSKISVFRLIKARENTDNECRCRFVVEDLVLN